MMKNGSHGNHRARAKNGGIWLVVQILAGVVILAVLGVLLWTWWGYRKSAETFTEMQQQYTAPAHKTSEEQNGLLDVDFEKLRQDWPDVVGWIQWPLMNLDFPIVHGSTNNEYLRRLPDGTWNNGGSIFLEANNQGILDWHAIVYGHNMSDGSMFGQFKKYLQQDFFLENCGSASFVLYTPDGVWQYDVFSIEKVQSTDTSVYMVGYVPGEEFTDFVQAMKDRSLYDMGVEVDGSKPVMTLSTCATTGKDEGVRVVMHAVQGQRLDQENG